MIVAGLATLSMTYGNLAALVQENAVRLLAYSSIAQSGYLLLGVVAVGRCDLALTSLVVFAAAYAAMNLGAFAVVAQTGRHLRDFAGFGRSRPAAGAAIEAGFAWLAVVAILNSVLSLAVYLRIVVPMHGPPKVVPALARSVTAVWTIALVATVAVGLAAQLLVGRIA